MDDNTNTIFMIIVGVIVMALIVILFQDNIGDLINGALGSPNVYHTH